MARVTSSRDRSRGRSSRPVTTSRGRANRQGASNALVSSSTNRPSGGNARVTRNQDSRRPPSAAGTRDNTRPTSPSSTGRSLPPQGGSSGNSPRAQMEAGWARDRGAKAQVARVGRTLQILGRGAARAAGVDRFSQAQNRLNQSARGTRGEGTRVVPPGGGNPGSRPQLPPGRQPAALPPGRQGGALANRPSSALANRPGSALANRPSSALATRPNSSPVDGRLVGVNVAEIQRRPRLSGQRALPSGQRALPPGRQGGNLATRPGGQRSLPPGRQGGSLSNRPSSGGGGGNQLPGSSVRGRLPGGTGGADRVTGGGVRTGRPGANRPALPPGASARGAATASARGGRVGGGPLEAVAGAVLTPLVQAAGRSAGQWLGRNVLLPMVDRYEAKTPGTQSNRERRRTIVREGGRQGPPVPERIRRGRPQQASSDTQQPSTRPSRSGGGSYNPPSGSQGRPQTPASRPRPQGSPSTPVSAPPGVSNFTPTKPRNADSSGFQVPGSPLKIEPAPLPGSKPQAPVTAGAQRPTFRGPGAPQPLPESTSAPAPAPNSTPAASGGQSERPRAQESTSRSSRAPSRAPTLDGSLDNFQPRRPSSSTGGIQRDGRAPKKSSGNTTVKIETEKRKKARQN